MVYLQAFSILEQEFSDLPDADAITDNTTLAVTLGGIGDISFVLLKACCQFHNTVDYRLSAQTLPG